MHESEGVAVHGQSFHEVDIPLGILGARQLLAETDEPETVVHALFQDAAEPRFALQHRDLRARLARALGGGKPCGTSAYDDDVVTFHSFTSAAFLLSA